ncbi:MAG: D-alanyl-D-alanine carboxypeptidase [Eggerthellaceae bacterium]|nr:D-alanyl-D-alanine carboxypeptidase [Eggerthellaceae bacterium]
MIDLLCDNYTKMARSASRLITATLLIVVSCALLTAMFTPSAKAYAEVRKADIIAGSTVEQRDIPVASCPSVDAEYAVLVDSEGTVLFERNGDTPAQIASITKVMTAIVAIDNAREGTVITVSEKAASIGESSASLAEGDVLDFETALKALLVPSGNDAAQALAETVGAQIIESDPSMGSDPVAAFVAMMNRKATEIGCENTVYENPHGLDDGEYAGNLHSTAKDQAKVAKSAMEYDVIRQIVGAGDTTISVERDGKKEDIKLESTDGLLEMYDEAIGVKTGVTDLAGPSFMGAANKDNRELYSVVLDSTDEHQRFEDTKNLFMWAYDHVRDLKLANSEVTATTSLGGQAHDVPVIASVSHSDWIDETVDATLADPEASISVFDLEGNVSQSITFDELHGTIHEGDKVGSVVFKQRNMVVAEQDLVACETVEAPNPLETMSIWWMRLVGGIQGEPAQAESLIYNVMPVISNNVSNAA